MFHQICAIFGIYLLIRFVYPLNASARFKVPLGALIMVVAVNRWLSSVVFGDMFSPEVPGWLLMIVGALFGGVVFLSVALLVADLIALVARPFVAAEKVRRALAIWRHWAALLSLALGSLAVWNASRVPEVRRVQISVRDLPADLLGMRIVQLTDLHVSPLLDANWLDEVVKRTNALQPDAIVMTGDYIDGWMHYRKNDVIALKDLKAHNGIYGSLGNHEYYFDAAAWTQELGRLGVKVLVNNHVTVKRGTARLLIAGTSDEEATRHNLPEPDAALAIGQEADADVVLLLRHRPTGIAQSQALGVDLQLSGHTHGGMIWGADRIVAKANGGFVSGLYNIGSTQLYVSNGTGLWNGFPLRLGVPPEITEFTLVRAD